MLLLIYNEALHSNVKIKPTTKLFDTEQLVDYIFNEMSNPKKKFHTKYGDVLEFVAHYFTLDYITISNEDKFLHIAYPQGSRPAPKIIPTKLFDDIALAQNTMLVLNNREHLEKASKELQDYYVDLNINASLIIKCSTKNKKYGYLRVDMQRERVWTKEEKIVFMTLAKIFALYSEMENK